MGYTPPETKLVTDLRTRDSGAYLRFVAANVCNTTARMQGDEQGKLPANPYFNAEARAYHADRFTILRIKTQGGNVQAERTVADIQQDEQRRYVVSLPISGYSEFKQLSREVQCLPNSMLMVSGAEPLSFKKLTDHDGLTVLLPRAFVEERMTDPEDICCRPVAGPSGLHRLIFSSMASLHEEAPDMTPEDIQKTISIFSELIILALGHMSDVRSSTSPVRFANLARVKRIVRGRCENPELSLTNIAAECGMSLRYLHNLFKDDGRTVSEYIMYERLRRARRMLEAASPLSTTVTDICFASGFSNLSHFSTAFRRAFSVSPVDVLKKR